MRTLVKDIVNNEGKEVELAGWVDIRRDHGKLIFVDLRDRTGLVQMVVLPSETEAHGLASQVRPEWVISVVGQVNKRPEKLVNKELPTGEFEILVKKIVVLNEANTPPIDVRDSGLEIGEESRMKYRYLDLRRARLQKNIRNRHKVIKFIRDYLDREEFIEVETPILTKSTPEGARDYLVPSRIEPGNFYALPQSPQQYKQLLMIGGVERYFQIARCFRDEDTRGDRQPEFTQMDLEMSFVEQEDVMKLNEEMLIGLVQKLYPEKKIQQIPFPRMTYKEAMEKYGTDRPDLRKNKEDKNELAFCWVIDFPFFAKTDKEKLTPLEKSRPKATEVAPTAGRSLTGWTFTHNPFSAPKQEFMNDLLAEESIENILTSQYDVVLNGWEIGGGSIRNHRPEALDAVFSVMGMTDKERASFRHMWDALGFGAPPHGGIAWGLDRLMMILENEPNIREVIPFPKTGDGRDLMMSSPSEVGEEQLKELGIKVIKK